MDEEVNEYNKWKNSKYSFVKKITANISAWHLILFFFLIVGGSWAMTSGKISPNMFWGSIVFFLLIFIFMGYKGPGKPVLIPEPIIKQIVQEALEKA